MEEKSMDNNNEKINDEEFEYKNRMVAFIDILGFKDIVNESKDKCQIIKEIIEAMDLAKDIKKLAELMKKAYIVDENNDKHKIDMQLTLFSDSVIISINDDKKIKTELYNAFFNNLKKLAYALARRNFFLRGGITYGKLYHVENKCFGPAMNKAYALESTVANYPRIVVDKKALEEINKLKEEYVITDKIDSIEILDYLYMKIYSCISSENKDESAEYLKSLLEIKNNVEKNILKFKDRDNEKLLIKYQWYKNYYNDTIQKILPSEQKDEFLIK
jgi:hypothetical protein